MKTATALLLISSLAFAQAPDAPLADTAGAVHLDPGEPAPFGGYLHSESETLREAKKLVACEAELDDAKTNGILLPRLAVAGLISGAAVAIVTSITLGIALANKR